MKPQREQPSLLVSCQKLLAWLNLRLFFLNGLAVLMGLDGLISLG